MGFRVHPLKPRDKVPILDDWPNAATLQPEIARAWWTERQDCNVGIVVSRGLAVLDIDPKNGGLISLEALVEAHGALPPTPQVKTGSGGSHYYFGLPDGVVLSPSLGKLAPGIDFPKQVVAPPSIHPSGTPYSWLGEARLGEVPLAPMPDWMLAELLGTAAGTGKATPPTEWEGLASGGANNGTRNANLARIAGHLLRRYVNPALVLSLVQSWNAQNCHPPLTDTEAQAVCESIAAIELRRREATP
jgi:hypothetical protein